jgi:hypothetical protein
MSTFKTDEHLRVVAAMGVTFGERALSPVRLRLEQY